MVYWRDNSGQDKVNEICPAGTVRIHRYTTYYTDEQHDWIHQNAQYKCFYEEILREGKEKGCCSFLKKMLESVMDLSGDV